MDYLIIDEEQYKDLDEWMDAHDIDSWHELSDDWSIEVTFPNGKTRTIDKAYFSDMEEADRWENSQER